MNTQQIPDNLVCRLRMALVFGFVLGSVLLAAPPVQAADDVTDRVQAHLSAGEYSSAVQLAENAPAQQRDILLQQIAEAQNAHGARPAADQTLTLIDNDHVRAGTLDNLLEQRFGGGPPILAQIGGGVGGGGGESTTADFEQIIELITTTIEPESWEETGGTGTIAEFEGGVVVDTTGVLQKVASNDASQPLAQLRAREQQVGAQKDIRQASELRKVSLNRLEKAIQLRAAQGRGPDLEMQLLAGLTRVEYVLVYPESGDLVLAGPAGDWQRDAEGRFVNTESGRPVMHLDDLVVVLRRIAAGSGQRFGCSITPRQDSLARVNAFVAKSAEKPLKPGRRARERWLNDLREAVGKQDIEIYGIDPGTRAARILVEADYHMKLVGIGLEDGVDGVTSYLDSINLKPGEAPPPMEVLRWWFTLDYESIETTEDKNAFHLRGQGVKVLSENELLTQMGKRVHTGKSDELNSRFASSFTKHFEDLAIKYPVYAELQNIFDLAMVAEICRQYQLTSLVGWEMATFNDPDRFAVESGAVPKEVDTVINHRMVGKKQIIAGVSGGVRVDPSRLVTKDRIETKDSGAIVADYAGGEPTTDRWWWD